MFREIQPHHRPILTHYLKLGSATQIRDLTPAKRAALGENQVGESYYFTMDSIMTHKGGERFRYYRHSLMFSETALDNDEEFQEAGGNLDAVRARTEKTGELERLLVKHALNANIHNIHGWQRSTIVSDMVLSVVEGRITSSPYCSNIMVNSEGLFQVINDMNLFKKGLRPLGYSGGYRLS